MGEKWSEITRGIRHRISGERALKSNGLSQNGSVINYTQLMASRQVSMRGNAITGGKSRGMNQITQKY